jgi:hypothetical protein
MQSVYVACILAGLFAMPAAAQEPEDLDFASGLEQFRDIHGMLPTYLNNIGQQMLAERQRRVEGLVTIKLCSDEGLIFGSECWTISEAFPKERH